MSNIIQFPSTKVTTASRVVTRAQELAALTRGDSFHNINGQLVHVIAERDTGDGREILITSAGIRQWVHCAR